jgi:hypothetical protein
MGYTLYFGHTFLTCRRQSINLAMKLKLHKDLYALLAMVLVFLLLWLLF